jgi:hypothetical protein
VEEIKTFQETKNIMRAGLPQNMTAIAIKRNKDKKGGCGQE